MVLETSRDLHKSIKVDPASEQEISNSYTAPIIESLPNICSAPSGYLPSPSSPSSSTSSSSSSPSSTSTSPTPSLSSAPTSVASSQASLPLSPQQATAISPKLDMCQSSQINPSAFQKDHPMFGVSAEEDAEFKHSLCSDDNDDSSTRLDDDQPQSQSQQHRQEDEQHQQPEMNDNKDEEDDNDADDDDSNEEESQMNVDRDSEAKETSSINQEQVDIKKSEINQAEQETTVELRLLVRRREAGALIGKRGSNIKRLRESFKSSMFSIPDTGNGPERVVCITSNEGSVDAILEDLTQLLMEKSPENDEQIELKLLIHSSHAGSIIGIGGQSIKKLRNDSKAAIKIYEMCCPLSNERVCAIKAKPPVVVSTIKLIQTILNENPIKGTIKPYDALHFDLNLVEKYGGYLPDDVQSVEMITNHHHAHPHHHHYDQTRVGFNARHHAHDNYPVAEHYSIWRSSEFQNACEMTYENPRKLGHHAPVISDVAPCSIDHHHHLHHNQMANNPVVDMRSKSSAASFHMDNTQGVRGSQEACEEQKGTSIHPTHIGCGIPRSVRFHPYASPQQTMAARGQLDYATSPYNSSGPQAVSALRHHQQQLTSNLNPNSYPAPSRLHYQHQSNVNNTNQMIRQHSRNQYMRASAVYQPNNIAERCRHLRPCLCMLLPMNQHPDILTSTAPLFQFVKNLNHHPPRNLGEFNGSYSGNHNMSNNNSNSNSNSGNGNNNNNSNNANTNNTDGSNINNKANTKLTIKKSAN